MVFTQQSPLAEIGWISAGIFQQLFRFFQAESPPQQVGGNKGAGPAMAMPAMDQYLSAEINSLVKPLQRFLHLLQRRDLFVGRGQVINLKTRLFLYFVQIGKFSAQVDDCINFPALL